MNISGKIVIISNLIQVQKPVRGVDLDQPGARVDPAADASAAGDQDFRALSRPDDEEVASAGRLDVLDPADLGPVEGHHPAADQLVLVERILRQGLELFIGDQDVRAGQGLGPGDIVDPLELEEVEPLERPQVLDLVGGRFAAKPQKDPGKKKAFPGTAGRARP